MIGKGLGIRGGGTEGPEIIDSLPKGLIEATVVAHAVGVVPGRLVVQDHPHGVQDDPRVVQDDPRVVRDDPRVVQDPLRVKQFHLN